MLQLFNASHDIAFNVVVALYVVLLHIVEPAVGVLVSVVYLTTVHHAHATQLIVLVLPLNQYPTGVHVGAPVGAVVSFIITKLVHVIGHPHVSLTLICTVVVHSAGVHPAVLALVHNDTQLHHVLYSILAGDGHRIHHNVHTVVPA